MQSDLVHWELIGRGMNKQARASENCSEIKSTFGKHWKYSHSIGYSTAQPLLHNVLSLFLPY